VDADIAHDERATPVRIFVRRRVEKGRNHR
jgi:hypothetical protein